MPRTARARRACYTVETRGDFVLVEDLDEAISVTNDAENIVADLFRAGHLANGRRVLYRDTMARWDELLHDGVRFTGFRALGGLSPGDAIRRARATSQ